MPNNGFYNNIRENYHFLKTALFHYKNALVDPRPKFLVLNYHRVMPELTANPLGTIISQKTFIRQIEKLGRKFPIISLDAAFRQSASGKESKKVQVAITFDDGYLDNLEIAFPVLKKMGLVAAFFIVTDYIGSNHPLWEQELITAIMGNSKIDKINIEGQVLKKGEDDRLKFGLRILERMKSVPGNLKRQIIASLREGALNGPSQIKSFNRCMNWEEVRRLYDQGMIIGSHGASHSSLAKLPLKDAFADIERSKLAIEEKLGMQIMHFAFPFGSSTDYTQGLISHVFKTGFKTCLTNVRGYNYLPQNTCCFKRIAMHEKINLNFLLG